jgi:anti-sigma regulatory factor (Ser/Thr protein kinase)
MGPALPGEPLAAPGPLVEVVCGSFPGQAEQVGKARRFIRDVLGQDWPRLDDVLILASEIASNAVRHTASGDGGIFEVSVAVFAAADTVRVAVTDQGGSSEPVIAHRSDAGAGLAAMPAGGRGLRIVDVLADRWGYRGDELGRTVWFEIVAKPTD